MMFGLQHVTAALQLHTAPRYPMSPRGVGDLAAQEEEAALTLLTHGASCYLLAC